MTSLEKQEFIVGVTIFCIYAFITLLSIVSYLKRELYVFQNGNYNISEYARNIRKNYRRYIFPFALCAVQFVMLATSYKKIYWHGELLIVFQICNIIISLLNRPFRKLLKSDMRTKRIMIIFFILTAIIFRISFFWSCDEMWCKCGMHSQKYWFASIIPFMIVNFALYLTPLLVCLSGILNKPFYSIKKYKEVT
ncbi:MAG: hypothetical protein K2J08_04895 [Ruminococcus sp.]|nr:hypothetical protein [Ruminococcus sp.]